MKFKRKTTTKERLEAKKMSQINKRMKLHMKMKLKIDLKINLSHKKCRKEYHIWML